MVYCSQTFFEVDKEGRILTLSLTRLNLVAAGTFSGDSQERGLEGDDILPETFKTPIWKGHSQGFI